MSIDPAWIALIGTLCGGLGLKLLEYFLGRGQLKVTEEGQIRKELRGEVTELKAENRQLEADVDKWRREYYDLRDKNIERVED